jgi:hypothetical protein
MIYDILYEFMKDDVPDRSGVQLIESTFRFAHNRAEESRHPRNGFGMG